MSALVIALIIIALLIAGFGLLVEGLFWLLVIAAVLFAVAAITGVIGRRSVRS